MKFTSLVATLFAITLSGVIAFAQSVTYDFDKSARFSNFRTYAWVTGTEIPDQFNHARIVEAVSRQLGVKGLARVERIARPDVFVAYHAAFDSSVQVTGFADGWGPYRLGGMRTASVRAEEVLTGTLVVDVIDARTNTIVWRGASAREIDVKATPAKREKNLNRAIERIFRNYPPSR